MSRLRVAIYVVLFLAVTAFGLSRITLNVDVLALLPADLPEVKGLEIFYQQFSRGDELIVTLEGDGAETGGKSLAELLRGRDDLVKSVVWNLPLQSDPEVAADLLAYLWFNADPVATKKLIANLSPDHIELELEQVIQNLAEGMPDQESMLRAYDPLGLVSGLPKGIDAAGLDPSSADSAFASTDQRFRVLYLKAATEESMDYKQAELWINDIQSVISEWQESARAKHPDWAKLEVAFTGEPAFVAEIGSSMEKDMHTSITSTILLICLLFWIMHRRLLPLFWLVVMLVVVFGLTLALASVVIGELSIMSVGFAAILIGLTIDYGVVLYKEARLAPGDVTSLRRLVGPSILWAAATTAAVFFALQFSSFPGIAQLGALVAIGVLVAAVVMLLFYAPVAARAALPTSKIEPSIKTAKQANPYLLWVLAISLSLPLLAVITLYCLGLPTFEQDFKPMQVRNSPSMAATEKMQIALSQQGSIQQPVVIESPSLAALPDRMTLARQELDSAVKRGEMNRFILPEGLVPNLLYQKKNRLLLSSLIAEQGRLVAAMEKAGFNDEAWFLGQQVFLSWTHFLSEPDDKIATPTKDSGIWLLERVFSQDDDGRCYVLGGITTDESSAQLSDDSLPEKGIYITGWQTLDPAIQGLIEHDSLKVFLPVLLALIAMLFFVFRDWRDVTLSLSTLLFSLLLLLALSSLWRIEWNAFSLCSVPILFGVGLDYGIHMLFALRRSDGDLREIRVGIAKAILFCGLSTAIGFGSLSFASNLGLASIGRICGLGVLIIMLVTLILLPHWWCRMHRKNG
ncbi:MAG: MMPL family transporter [Verrucomicrobiales bacterium]|nr:MMPL family transporter [Verrucomicrobiales bacterium]